MAWLFGLSTLTSCIHQRETSWYFYVAFVLDCFSHAVKGSTFVRETCTLSMVTIIFQHWHLYTVSCLRAFKKKKNTNKDLWSRSIQSLQHLGFCVNGDEVSCLSACNVADTVVCADESLINATSRKQLVNKYNTLGNTLTEASGVQRTGAAGRIDTASDINLDLSSVRA